MAKLSIGARPHLCGARGFRVLGCRPFSAYSEEEWRLVREAPVVYYPTGLYAGVLAAAGKPLFPGPATYRLVGDKLAQSALFRLLGLPHPRTGAYPRPRWGRIAADFAYPFVAKLPRHGSRGRGVWLIEGADDLAAYLGRLSASGQGQVAYVQEYLDLERDLRVVCFNRRPIHAYWRERAGGEWRSNVSVGGRVSLAEVPEAALDLAAQVAERCGFDEVGLDLCQSGGRFLVIEANMAFGTRGFEAAGKDFLAIIKSVLESDDIESRLLGARLQGGGGGK